MTDGRRPLRVAEQIRGFLAAQLTSHSGDPRLSGLVVTRVDVPPDMQIARVGVRLLVGDDDPALRKRSLVAVQRASGRLRAGLGRLLRAKRVPELRFEYDDGHDTANRVAELLGEIDREPKAAPDEPPGDG
jgi:ribosome-binding factor A